MFYTIIPEDVIYKKHSVNTQERLYMGELVQVAAVNNSLVVSRVISTNPQAYLKTELQPGAVIRTMN